MRVFTCLPILRQFRRGYYGNYRVAGEAVLRIFYRHSYYCGGWISSFRTVLPRSRTSIEL